MAQSIHRDAVKGCFQLLTYAIEPQKRGHVVTGNKPEHEVISSSELFFGGWVRSG